MSCDFSMEEMLETVALTWVDNIIVVSIPRQWSVERTKTNLLSPSLSFVPSLKMRQNHCLLLPEPKKTCVALYGQTTYSH